MKFNKLKIIVLLFSVFLLFVVNSTSAQTEFGVKGGVLFSGINKDINSAIFDFEERTGFAAGIFLKKHNLLGPIGLQTELLYQLKGGNFFHMYPNYETSVSSGGYYGGYGYFDKRKVPGLRNFEKFHYLSVPILFSFTPVSFLDVYAGPEAGYMISSSKISMFGNDLNNLSAGLTAGFAVKISDNTNLDARYSQDLTRVVGFGDSDIKNYSFTVGLQKTLFRKQK